MNTAILYMTQHGCTEKAALELARLLPGKTELFNLYKVPAPDLNQFDTVIIGGSIHFGRIQAGLQKFCNEHRGELIYKNLGLFICCMETGKNAEAEFENAFEEPLRRHAIAKGIFGGEFNLKKMTSFERMVIRHIASVRESTSRVDTEAIQRFAKQLASVAQAQ
ncbi:MAG: flavodoxin domain-containing protein [Bacteroidales bacterium]